MAPTDAAPPPFEPKHSHPFTLFEATTILDVSTLTTEISRLENSIAHLRRTNDELRAFEAEEQDVQERKELADVARENELTVEAQTERIEMCRRALVDKLGYDPTSGSKAVAEQTAVIAGPTANAGDFTRAPPASQQAQSATTEEPASEEGVFL